MTFLLQVHSILTVLKSMMYSLLRHQFAAHALRSSKYHYIPPDSLIFENHGPPVHLNLL